MDPQQKITALIAGLLVLGTFVLLIARVPVPEQIWSALLLVVGFYFGNVTGYARARFMQG